MARYREVEERRVYDDGPAGPMGRPPYANPVAWMIGLLIVVLLIVVMVFALGHTGTRNNVPVVRRPSTSSTNSGTNSGSGSGSVNGTSGSTSGSAGGGGTSGSTTP